MARYGSIEIVPREIFVVGHEAAMVWTINGVSEEGAVSFDGVDGSDSTTQASSAVSARSGSAARVTVSSSALAARNPTDERTMG
jgi:hypothetical protein